MRIYCVLCENIPLEFPYVTPYNIGIKAACTDDCKISLKWNQEENYEKMEQYDAVSYTHLTLPTTPYV